MTSRAGPESVSRLRQGGRTTAGVVVAFALALALAVAVPSAKADTAEVTIANMAFSPPTVQVEAVEGEAELPGLHAHVLFVMRDAGVFHTVSFDQPGVGSSGNLAAGQTYDAVISQTGTFTYRCDIHPAMRGTIVVVRAPTPPPSADEESGNNAVIAIFVVTVVVAGVVAAGAFRHRRRTQSTTTGGRQVQSGGGRSKPPPGQKRRR